MDESRAEALIKLISELKKENEILKRILKDNNIKFGSDLIENKYDNNQGARILPISITKIWQVNILRDFGVGWMYIVNE